MKAVRVNRAAPEGTPYSSTNPAPLSAVGFVDVAEVPHATRSDQLVVQVKASSVIRDSLTWGELYNDPAVAAQLGNDFSGIVTETNSTVEGLKVGDAVYGMISAHRGGAWAEYVTVTSEEAFPKPEHLSWEEAAALPLSALTADQALFSHAGLSTTGSDQKRVLVTGASGGVGSLVVQFAAIAGHHVIAASSSISRNERFLRSLGATEIIEYDMFPDIDPVDVVIDTVGGSNLAACWKAIKLDGIIISVDSHSYTFGDEHKQQGLTKGKEAVRWKFFVVEPSRVSMARISDFVSVHGVKGQVARTLPLSRAREAYELAHSRDIGRGKIILTI